MHREILGLFLTRLELIEKQIETLEAHIATALHGHQDAVQRLAEVPGYGIDSAQQVIAEGGGRCGFVRFARTTGILGGHLSGAGRIGGSLEE
jgi:transposase